MSRRVQKVAELLRELLAELIKENLSEELGLVTLTAVNVSNDLKEATVYISCYDKSSEEEVLRTLEQQTRGFQRQLGRQLVMKFTPRLTFKIEQGLEKINRIEEILNEIKNNGS